LSLPSPLQRHWQNVYLTKAPDQVSWFRPHLETSLAFIERATGGKRDSAIIDAGGGASSLVDDLLLFGYSNLTVLDISQAALDIARARIHASVEWICGDVLNTRLRSGGYDVWHDRAVFHFLTSSEDRRQYRRQLETALPSNGQVILATFGPEGPLKCSGLGVTRYSADSLTAELGSGFRLIESITENHQTPFGASQQFVSCRFARD
jgi:hypothetical protein